MLWSSVSVTRYVGEILSDEEANSRADDSYLFDLDNRVFLIFCYCFAHTLGTDDYALQTIFYSVCQKLRSICHLLYFIRALCRIRTRSVLTRVAMVTCVASSTTRARQTSFPSRCSSTTRTCASRVFASLRDATSKPMRNCGKFYKCAVKLTFFLAYTCTCSAEACNIFVQET